jgi:ATP-dependent Clp protease ATP-binding subunit ClpC
MSSFEFNPHAGRVQEAKAAAVFTTRGIRNLLKVVTTLFALAALFLIYKGEHQGFSLAGIAVIGITTLLWISRDLMVLEASPITSTTSLDLILPASVAIFYNPNLTFAAFWDHFKDTDQAVFLMVRFQLMPESIGSNLGATELNHDALWTEVSRLTAALGLVSMTEGTIFAALFHLTPGLEEYLTSNKLTLDELDEGAHWAARLDLYERTKRPIYGGLARDWSSGYTPLLSRFGTNLSEQVEFAGRHFHTEERTNQLDALVQGLDSANGSVVLVGERGIGKTAILLGLADRLLQGKESGSLKHHQIYALNASFILSNGAGPGDIEELVLSLLQEAVLAGNIVIALDEAQLFFGDGTGSVNLSQVLLPLLQSRRLKLVLALTPGDWQRLKSTNSAMASLLTPLVLKEADQKDGLRMVADRALLLEQGKVVITWRALTEAYRLAGRYFQEEAYPGRAIKLLESSLNYPEAQLVNEASVQQAIESQFGVKVHEASSTESDSLLHMEDLIHQRMINQTRAVSVVSNALRRARAGVSNPKRPIGSFLFLGPTGVGKTELAKSLAAIYFDAEQNVIRLDMSEYQQIKDVDRILGTAEMNPDGLLPKLRQTPFSVVLFDEIEKAHPNVLNLFLQMLDEGNLTDSEGHSASFKDAIVIATSNAGADEIRAQIEAGKTLESFEAQFTNDLINSGAFKPELLNRFDEIVLFRPLNEAELGQVVHLLIAEVNKTLENQKIKVALTDDAIAILVRQGYDPRLGARPMRRMVQRRVEDTIAQMILKGEAKPGATVTLDSTKLSEEPAPADTPIPPNPQTPAA